MQRLLSGLSFLALFSTLTLTACGQSPTTAPTASASAAEDLEASSLLKSPEEKAVAMFLKQVVREQTMRVTKVVVSGGTQRAFKAQVQVQNAESKLIPARGLKTWEGSLMKLENAGQKTNRYVVNGRDISFPSNPGPRLSIIVTP